MDQEDITRLLADWSGGEDAALEMLIPLVYGELHSMAKRYMNSQDSRHTLQTTALIHEAYIKLAAQKDKRWEGRTHFFAVAARAMRHILVDHARAKTTGKRNKGNKEVSLEEAAYISNARGEEVVALDEALKALEMQDKRKSRVVELRYFGGLSLEETAAVLQVSQETVVRDWRFAKAWLLRELSKQ